MIPESSGIVQFCLEFGRLALEEVNREGRGEREG
jgi:hypothetical protein